MKALTEDGEAPKWAREKGEAFMLMGTSVVLFATFFLNVAMGAFGNNAFLDSVPEMLLMAASAAFFVAAILVREAKAKASKQ